MKLLPAAKCARNLKDHFRRANIPATGPWHGAGGELCVGDRIPDNVWPCKDIQVIDLDTGAKDSAADDVAVWHHAQQRKALEQPLPVLIKSRRIQGESATV